MQYKQQKDLYECVSLMLMLRNITFLNHGKARKWGIDQKISFGRS